MIKKTISYTDYDNQPQKVDAYFHLNKTELASLYLTEKNGLDGYIEAILQSSDNKKILDLFKRIVDMSYGVKEGGRFIKNAQNLEDFKSSGAYDEFLWTLLQQEDDAAEFINGLLPADFNEMYGNVVANQESSTEETTE